MSYQEYLKKKKPLVKKLVSELDKYFEFGLNNIQGLDQKLYEILKYNIQ